MPPSSTLPTMWSMAVRPTGLPAGVALVRGEILAAAEHHVLEEMGEAAFALLDFVAGAGADDQIESHKVLVLGRHSDHAQAVGEGIHRPGIREKFREAVRLRENRVHRHQHDYGQKTFHPWQTGTAPRHLLDNACLG
jgi:hypothetical protein